jgi:4-carboxymuconolactone decarboxylase
MSGESDTAGMGQGPHASEEPGVGAPGGESDSRTRGMAKMREVYGFSLDPADMPGDYAAFTVDHLFGTVWTRPGLDVRERRLLTVGVLAAQGLGELLEIQFAGALARGELDVAQVREVVVHLAHYVGWPLSTGLQAAAERAIAAHERPSGGGSGAGGGA